jgi:hypothetical protein
LDDLTEFRAGWVRLGTRVYFGTFPPISLLGRGDLVLVDLDVAIIDDVRNDTGPVLRLAVDKVTTNLGRRTQQRKRSIASKPLIWSDLSVDKKMNNKRSPEDCAVAGDSSKVCDVVQRQQLGRQRDANQMQTIWETRETRFD